MFTPPNVDTDTAAIKRWQSGLTLVTFVLANITVLFPFHIPTPVPLVLYKAGVKALVALRVIPPRACYDRRPKDVLDTVERDDRNDAVIKPYVWFRFPINFVTGPLIAVIFLLIIGAIGAEEIKGGIAGTDSIVPYDILLFFYSLAYIAMSIDASGLIKYLAFKVLQLGGKAGHRLYFFLYVFFFALGSFIGNDPIILSGTPFLAYMTRVSSNIVHPRAWIHTQFAIANIASAILVSSNPTNLVLAGAFGINFIDYTRDMVVPVVITVIALFPFLLYILFANESLIPRSIKMHELDEEARARKPVNPNIPYGRGIAGLEEKENAGDQKGQLLSLEEIMNPFLDKAGAAFGSAVMAAALITILVVNKVQSSKDEDTPVFYVTLPAAVVMFIFDLAWGWVHREETRKISRDGRRQIAEAAERKRREQVAVVGVFEQATDSSHDVDKVDPTEPQNPPVEGEAHSRRGIDPEKPKAAEEQTNCERPMTASVTSSYSEHKTLVSVTAETYIWLQETFPTVMMVLSHLPYALLPFSFEMFILVQGLVTKGWVAVFAYGWTHWVKAAGTIGAIGGMGFLSVVLCNFAGTNIGTTILLSRVIQAWEQIHENSGEPIGSRTKWATIYSMALGVNYGAFSLAFSASLAGLLWRDILSRKHIHVGRWDFARINLPIVIVAMTIGLAVLTGEVYIFHDNDTTKHAS